MQALQAAGLLSQMLQDLDNNDLLLKMNIIELLSQLVITKHGYIFLETQGIIKKIFSHFENEDPLFSAICEPGKINSFAFYYKIKMANLGIIKFFGNMAYWKPTEMISKYPLALDKVFCNIQLDDLTLVGISLDTLGHIGEKNEGKYSLESTGILLL